MIVFSILGEWRLGLRLGLRLILWRVVGLRVSMDVSDICMMD